MRLWSLSWLRKVCGFSMRDISVLCRWKNRSSCSGSRKSTGSILTVLQENCEVGDRSTDRPTDWSTVGCSRGPAPVYHQCPFIQFLHTTWIDDNYALIGRKFKFKQICWIPGSLSGAITVFFVEVRPVTLLPWREESETQTSVSSDQLQQRAGLNQIPPFTTETVYLLHSSLQTHPHWTRVNF